MIVFLCSDDPCRQAWMDLASAEEVGHAQRVPRQVRCELCARAMPDGYVAEVSRDQLARLHQWQTRREGMRAAARDRALRLHRTH